MRFLFWKYVCRKRWITCFIILGSLFLLMIVVKRDATIIIIIILLWEIEIDFG
jgi:MFS-type transporter involved in bile tolerance (Atg22 family)